MVYRVEVAQAAEAELEALYIWVVSRAPSQGAAWFNGLERTMLALSEHPERYPVAPESAEPDRPIRCCATVASHTYTGCSSPWIRVSGLCVCFT